MALFRKKPVVIEAMQWDGTAQGASPIIDWVLSAGGTSTYFDESTIPVLHIRTLEGLMTAGPSDWIIKGVKNEFYPCKPDIFRETYDSVDD